MSTMYRSALASILLSSIAGTALAQDPAPPAPTASGMPETSTAALVEEANKQKEPQRGDFDAGGQVRFPNGPDEAGDYKTFNWIALDLKGKYHLLKSVTVNGNIPLAVKKPDMLMTGIDPRLIGGVQLRLDAMLPATPKLPFVKYETEIGLSVSLSYMREGALLLSEKDFPLFAGDLQPGISGALITKVKLSSLVDFSFVPSYVFQKGEAESLTALQIPMSLILKAGSLLKVSADVGIFTGDDISLRAKHGGRIYAGAALDLKLGPIITHLGAGVASLFTDPMGLYPAIGDSVYFDVNVKYAK
jgi:hypothetical protein